MNEATSRWLLPLAEALRDHDPTGDTAGRLFDTAGNTPTALDASDTKPVGIDWIRYGQLIREELHMYDYPDAPPDLDEAH